VGFRTPNRRRKVELAEYTSHTLHKPIKKRGERKIKKKSDKDRSPREKGLRGKVNMNFGFDQTEFEAGGPKSEGKESARNGSPRGKI